KLHAYHPEIDRTFHRLLRSPRSSEIVNSNSLNSCAIASNITNFGSNYDFDPTNIFHVVCSIMRPYGIPEDYIKKKAFPFSLD
ncbi:hypothetical protein CR513_34107, partial [Mucuna pruriens]